MVSETNIEVDKDISTMSELKKESIRCYFAWSQSQTAASVLPSSGCRIRNSSINEPLAFLLTVSSVLHVSLICKSHGQNLQKLKQSTQTDKNVFFDNFFA